MNQIAIIIMICWTKNMIDWQVVIVLTIVAYIITAIWELVERICK